MDTHKNASLTPKGREAMVRYVEDGLSKAAAARQFNTTPKTVGKWVKLSAWKASMDCGIAPQGPIHCRAKRRPPHAPQSRLCADSATPASKSQPKWASPRPLLAVFSGTWD